MRNGALTRSAIGTTILAAAILLSGCAPAGETVASPTDTSEPTPAAPVIDDRPLEDQLAKAIGSQDLPLVEALIEAGVDVNATVGADLWPIHLAAAGDSAATINALIAAGADLEVRTSLQATPLLRAAQHGSGEVVLALLEAGAETEVIMGDLPGSLPLHLAAQHSNNDALVVLLEWGVDVETRTENYGATALSSAAYSGNLEGIQILVAHGADLSSVSLLGRTALGWARSNGHRNVIDYLVGIGAPE